MHIDPELEAKLHNAVVALREAVYNAKNIPFTSVLDVKKAKKKIDEIKVDALRTINSIEEDDLTYQGRQDFHEFIDLFNELLKVKPTVASFMVN